MNDDQVDTSKQLAARVGISEYHIKSLIRSGDLEHLQICSRTYIPSGAWPRYVEAHTKGGKRWQDETKDQNFSTSKSVEPSMSPGPSMVAAASARRVRQTASRLRSSSQTGSSLTESKKPLGLVISQVLISEILNDYLLEAKQSAQARAAYAVPPLVDSFGGCTVDKVTKNTCKRYAQNRGRSMGTVRRELGVLRAAINHAFDEGRITRKVAVELPDRPPARDRWLTCETRLRAFSGPRGRLRRGVICHYSSLSGSTLVAAKRRF